MDKSTFCRFGKAAAGILIFGLCSALPSFPTHADTAQAQHVELKSESYTSNGQRSGCGLSFVGAGITDGRTSLGLSGSANVLWLPDERQITTMIKIGALVDLKPALIRTGLIETGDQGRPSGWTTRQTGNPPMLLLVRNGDHGLPAAMASGGFTINVSIEHRPLDDSMSFPAASVTEQQTLKLCIEDLRRNLPAGAQ